MIEVDEGKQPWRGGDLLTQANALDNEENGNSTSIDVWQELHTVREGTGKTQKMLSWIWLIEGVCIDDSLTDSDDVL